MKKLIIGLAVIASAFAPTAFAMSDSELHNLLEWRDTQAKLWRVEIYESRNSFVDVRGPSYIPPQPPVYTSTQKFWLFSAGFSTFESAVNKLIENNVK